MEEVEVGEEGEEVQVEAAHQGVCELGGVVVVVGDGDGGGGVEGGGGDKTVHAHN